MAVRINRTSKLADEYGLISLSPLADAFQLSRQTVRELAVKPRWRGRRTHEAEYLIADIYGHLRELNPDRVNVWPTKSDRFMTPREASQRLSEAGRRITPNMLAKWRMRELGPPSIRVASRTIRYREEDLLNWLEESAEDK